MKTLSPAMIEDDRIWAETLKAFQQELAILDGHIQKLRDPCTNPLPDPDMS